MPRFLSITIPDEKKIVYSLQYVYGIGLSLAKKVLKEAKIDPDKKAKDVTEAEFNEL